MVIESSPDIFEEFKVNYILSNKDITLTELMHELHDIEDFYHGKKFLKKDSLQGLSQKTRINKRELG